MHPLNEYCLTVLKTQSLGRVLNSIFPKKTISNVEFDKLLKYSIFYSITRHAHIIVYHWMFPTMIYRLLSLSDIMILTASLAKFVEMVYFLGDIIEFSHKIFNTLSHY